jgi:hypothetical protein
MKCGIPATRLFLATNQLVGQRLAFKLHISIIKQTDANDDNASLNDNI